MKLKERQEAKDRLDGGAPAEESDDEYTDSDGTGSDHELDEHEEPRT